MALGQCDQQVGLAAAELWTELIDHTMSGKLPPAQEQLMITQVYPQICKVLLTCCKFTKEDQMNVLASDNDVAHKDSTSDGGEEEFEIDERNQYNGTLRSSSCYAFGQMSRQWPE